MAFGFKKYQWYDTSLRKKSQLFDRLTLLFALATLLCLYFVPGDAKAVNLLFLCLAIVMLWLSWTAQSQDKKLKADAEQQKALKTGSSPPLA